MKNSIEIGAVLGLAMMTLTCSAGAGAEAFAKLFIDDVKARKLAVAALFQ